MHMGMEETCPNAYNEYLYVYSLQHGPSIHHDNKKSYPHILGTGGSTNIAATGQWLMFVSGELYESLVFYKWVVWESTLFTC